MMYRRWTTEARHTDGRLHTFRFLVIKGNTPTLPEGWRPITGPLCIEEGPLVPGFTVTEAVEPAPEP
jgi:hypothetical protein